MHNEPSIVDLGFKSNRRGGWWYCEPSNAYTLQIVPTAKERWGWCLGIVRPGGMVWGKKAYPSPEAAAFQSFRVTRDADAADRLDQAMQARQDQRMQVIEQRIKQWQEAKLDQQRNSQ